MRFRAFRNVPLQPPFSQPQITNLGHSYYLYHWLRLTPQMQVFDSLKLVGQIDVPRGMIVGEKTTWVDAARDRLNENHWWGAQPRYLYLEYVTPIGMFRIGQQGSHWGMGLLANDGDHPTLFGDYRRGSLTERLLFATRPMGRDGPLLVAIAGDLIFEDNRAKLLDGDRALQAVGAIKWEKPSYELGLYGVYRNQQRDAESVDPGTGFTEKLEVGVVSLAGRFAVEVPGAQATVFGQFEGSLIAGTTDYVRNINLTSAGEKERIQAFGGAMVLGVARRAQNDETRWGDLVLSVELGYASGDADPGDGVTKRFTFDQNHNVGLVLFDHVMAWMTARSATVAADPQIVNRPAPGLQFLPSEGGIFGASYVYPTLVIRPQPWLDLKTAVLIAFTTADFVDPLHYGALGNYSNYYGGDDKNHDLGIELDLGIDGRIAAGRGATVQLGAEGGVLLPGRAFNDAAGNRLDTQYLINTKVGLQF